MPAIPRLACWPLLALLLLPMPAFAQDAEEGEMLRAEVATFLADFHTAAAASDAGAYLGCFREDAVILGSAPGERWDLEQYRALVQPVLAAGQEWNTVPYLQNVQVSADGTTAWFDERLHRSNGMEFRTSGVLRRGAEGWKFVLVSATFPVPNERALELAAKIREVLPPSERSIPDDSGAARALEDHYQAGNDADLGRFLGYVAEDAVLLGTDVAEHFTRADLRAMVEAGFAAGQGIDTQLRVLRVTESEDGKFAWFDARLDKPSFCEFRGSGLLRRDAEGWKIVHHDRAFVVPNELVELLGGRSPFVTPVPVEDLREDFAFLRRTMEEWHPALYVYETKEDMDRMFDNAMAAIRGPMTPLAFETLIGPVVARAHCLHTCIQLQGPHYVARYRSSTFLPFDPQVVDGQLVVRTCYVDDEEEPGRPLLAPGTEILAIDGRTAEDIIERLTATISADGRNRTLPIWELNFRFYLHYATHLGSPEEFELHFLEPGSTTERRRRVPALTPAQWDGARKQRGPHLPPWPGQEIETQVLAEEDLAILVHPTFRPAEPAKFFRTLRTFFTRLQDEGIGNLIVDLRGNSGGTPVQGSYLYSYLTDQPFTYFRFDPEKNTEADKLSLRLFLQPRQPARHHFQGRIFVLMDGRCTSTTGHVLAHLKQAGRAVLIGEEAGATFLCNDNSKEITLPATGLVVKIARTTYQADVTGLPAGIGVLPDHEVQGTVADMLAGRDPAMELARQLAREGN